MLRPIRWFALVLALAAAFPAVRAQQDGLLQIGDPLHEFLVRQQTLGHLRGAFLTHRPLSVYEARIYLDSLAAAESRMTAVDRRLFRRFTLTEPGPGVPAVRARVPWLYGNGRDFISAEGDGYGVQASPLAYLSAGPGTAHRGGESLGGRLTWQNTRGVRAAGHLDIGPTLFFESRIEENQLEIPEPAARFVRQQIVDHYARDLRHFDYFVVTGVVGLRSRFVELRFGRERNQWGAGTNDLILSGFAPLYDQLQIRTSVWRIQYTNLFTSFSDRTVPPDPHTLQYRHKYGVFHRLAIDLPGRVQLGFSEAAILAPSAEDRGPGFYMAFLNPIIFYRGVDSDIGSPANMLIAMDGQWTALRGATVYGQFMLDEFRASELFSRRGWWGNKWGARFGVHLVNPGLENLEVRAEYGRVRPFVYSSWSPSLSALHNHGVLGHPAGPNAEDLSVRLTYRPTDRLTGVLAAAFTRHGRNPGSRNLGADPVLPYTTREDDFGVHLLQGVRQNLVMVEARAGYELLPTLYLEGVARFGSTRDAEDPARTERYAQLLASLRWGLPFQSHRAL